LILAAAVFLFLRRRRVANWQPYVQQDAKPWESKELDGSEIRHPVEISASPNPVQVIELE
jgi:hypothetical protein